MLTGSTGLGEGDWRLRLTSELDIEPQAYARTPYGRQGFARVVNRSDTAGEVRIEAFDDTPWTYEALTLSIGGGETRHFNSEDLELGNAGKGLSGSTGAGEGDWRLEMTGELDIEVLSYVRTVGGQGYVTPMHDTAAQESEGLMRYYVPVFHPAGYESQQSRLHLVNLGTRAVRVGIDGLDDAGRSPPDGDLSLVLGAGETRVLTAAQLEDGDEGLDGRLGTGSGRWQLFVTAAGSLQVMSLGYSSDGFLANLSRGAPPVPVQVPAPEPGARPGTGRTVGTTQPAGPCGVIAIGE